MDVKSRNEIIRCTLVLFVITFVASLCLGLVNELTKDSVEQARLDKENKAVSVVCPLAQDITQVFDISDDYKINKLYQGSADGKTVGYIFNVTAVGYEGDIVMLVGIDTDGVITGISILESNETPGLGAEIKKNAFTNQFDHKKVNEFKIVKAEPGNDEIQSVSGATVSSRAVVKGVNTALSYFNEILKSGS